MIEKEEIRTLIPHTGEMCLLDRVLEWDEQQIVCSSESHREQTNPLRRHERLATLHALEYAAQATALHGALRARAAGGVAPPGYLVGLRDAHLYVERLDEIAAPLHIYARRIFGDGANTVYQCGIAAADKPIAEARVTIMLRK